MNKITADGVIIKVVNISASLPYGQCCFLGGVANIIKEMALWSTFYDSMLSCLLADPSRKVHLQGVDTIPVEDAIIVEKQQRLFVRSPGYGETKAEGRSSHDISVKFFRLTVSNKDTVDVHQLDSAFDFQIHGFIITFYLSQLLPSGQLMMRYAVFVQQYRPIPSNWQDFVDDYEDTSRTPIAAYGPVD
ncbi:uncharacterized protein BYT42DRAFT_646874 [Radiomyces spectabilis]|uniref:uncharacterized protein n=1 Tax=Radiomyces spectabilis TaxID=64574 RepID=UPI00221F4891|nr:uncharacterized protein BYT42DRAFT_646874 [Radiomyces spectabilis]KAI8372904.1 hypothetical protein BYT42DRAFT_646874 [Radiomyces spectabilis]